MTSPDFDRTIRGALSIPMSQAQEAELDRRLTARLAGQRKRGDVARLPRVPRLAFGLTMAFVLLAGSAVAGGTLFNRLVGGAPLLENVWDRATSINQSATDSGYTVVLEKAAVDRERVWVALSIAGGDVWSLHVTDANGVVIQGGTGAGTGIVNGVSASLWGLRIPAGVTPEGPYKLEVTTLVVDDREVHGHWTFTFDVPLTPVWNESAQATNKP
jgi:hypothetical protein